MSAITFHSEEISFVLKNKTAVRAWLNEVAKKHKTSTGEIAYVFCSDAKLLGMNQQFLHHDEYTDIITFDYSEGKIISGDIFISIDRVRENAVNGGIPFETELHRVMVHGVLHLIGFKDKSDADSRKMRAKEDEALLMLK